MANLSNVDPLTAGMQGATAGLQNGVVIQQLMANKTKMEREEAEAPLRTKLLEGQVSATGTANEAAKLDLGVKQREAAFAAQPWNPSAEPIFQTMDAPKQAEFLQMIKDQKVPLTMAGRSLFYKGFEMNTEMFKKMKEFSLEKINQNYAETGKMLTDVQNRMLAKDPNVTPEMLNQAREKYNAAKAMRDGAKDKFDKMEGSVAINNIAVDHADLLKGSPAVQMSYELAKATGDVKGFETILQHMVANEGKSVTEFDAYLRGELAAAKADGKPVDLKKVVRDFENLKDVTNIKVGTAHNFIDGDTLVTKIWDGRAWTVPAGAKAGSRWKPPSSTETNVTKGWQEFVKYNPDFAGMTQAEFQDMKAYQAIHAVPFPKTSRWYGKGGAPTRPSATAAGPVANPSAGAVSYKDYLK